MREGALALIVLLVLLEIVGRRKHLGSSFVKA